MPARKVYLTFDELNRLHHIEQLSVTEMGRRLSVAARTIVYWLKKFGIPVRIDAYTHWTGKKMSDATRQKMAETRRSKTGGWTITEERLRDLYCTQKLSTNNIAKRIGCSVQCVVDWIDNYKIPKRSRGEVIRGEGNPIYGTKRPEHVVEAMRRAATGRKQSEECRAKKAQYRGPKNGRWGKPPKHGRGEWFERKDGQMVWFRSSYEVRAAKAWDALGVEWSYEPRRFVLVDRTYCPDFYLPSEGRFIEIKGWFHERHQETIRQFRQCYPEIRLDVYLKDEIQELERRVVNETNNGTT